MSDVRVAVGCLDLQHAGVALSCAVGRRLLHGVPLHQRRHCVDVVRTKFTQAGDIAMTGTISIYCALDDLMRVDQRLAQSVTTVNSSTNTLSDFSLESTLNASSTSSACAY